MSDKITANTKIPLTHEDLESILKNVFKVPLLEFKVEVTIDQQNIEPPKLSYYVQHPTQINIGSGVEYNPPRPSGSPNTTSN